MSAREDERVRGILRDAVSAMVSEEIVAIGWFHRPGDVGGSWRKGPSLLRRVLSPRGDHPGTDWPRAEVRFAKGARTASSLMNATGNTYHRRLTQVTLSGPGGMQLVLELERDGVARAVVEAPGHSLAPA